MSGYWHGLEISVDGREVQYRPPEGATEEDLRRVARLVELIPAVWEDPAMDAPTVRLKAVEPGRHRRPHDDKGPS